MEDIQSLVADNDRLVQELSQARRGLLAMQQLHLLENFPLFCDEDVKSGKVTRKYLREMVESALSAAYEKMKEERG